MQIIYIDTKCHENYLQTPLNGKNAAKFNKKFVINYDEDSDKGYIFKVAVKYPKRPYNFQSELPFFLERMKINKCNKLV